MSHARSASSELPGRHAPAAGIREAANDDDGLIDVPLLRAALRLSDERGAGAARFAHAQAERAYFAGGGAPYRWWLALTRVLDRMLATDFGAAPADEARPRV